MDNNLLSIIKKEKENIIEDKNDNFLQLSCDVKVKVENCTLDNWCLQNFLLNDYQEPLNYDNLKEETINSCSICSEYFINNFSLYKHNLKHLKVPLVRHKFYLCDACPNFYKTKNDLRDHIITTHIEKTLYNGTNTKTASLHKCKICKKIYPYKSWFDHIKNVHSQNKLQCYKCDMFFKCKRYLKRHILYVHEGVKPRWRGQSSGPKRVNVKCPKCPRNLSCNNSLTTHLRNCHSEKTFQCKICKSILKSKPYLLTHMKRVHYDDGKLHNCDICGKIFKSPRYVRVHIKNSHTYLK